MIRMTDELRREFLEWIYAYTAYGDVRDELVLLCQEQETPTGDPLPAALTALAILIEATTTD